MTDIASLEPTPAPSGLDPGTPPPGSGRSIVATIARTFVENRLAAVGAVLLLGITLFCFLGPLLYHTNQVGPNLVMVNLRPGPGGPLGSDNNGFDILGRLMAGGRTSLEISFAVACTVTVLGATYGAVAGYLGGAWDVVMMRIVDIGLSMPVVFLFILVSRIYFPTKGLLIILLALTVWFVPARLVRGETLTLRTRDFVAAARTMGGGAGRLVFRHIVPNAAGTIIVNATFQVADAIIVLATLEFLGFSLPPPAATWGGMLSDGSQFLQDGYWWEVFPALVAIVVTVIAVNFVGDALRDAFDVRLRRR
jgi:peptide/nickel transport system permease protein